MNLIAVIKSGLIKIKVIKAPEKQLAGQFDEGYAWAFRRLVIGIHDTEIFLRIRNSHYEPSPFEQGAIKAYDDWMTIKKEED